MITANDIKRALWTAHQPPQWAYLDEVANATGYAGSRYIDGVAMSLWVSMGLEIHGFEVKVSKSDWSRELAHPKKAEVAIRDLDRFWVVAPVGIVDKASVPKTWGLKTYNPETGDLRTVIKAPRLPSQRDDDHAIPRPLVAAMLRRATETQVPKDMVETLAQQRAQDIAKDRSEEIALRSEIRALEARLDEQTYHAKRLSELDALFPRWQRDGFISAVKTLQKLQVPHVLDSILCALEKAASARDSMASAIATLNDSDGETRRQPEEGNAE